jgi:hypothetical protein
VAQTIFDVGTLLHKKRAADAAFDQAAETYRSTVIAAFQNVADTLHALQFGQRISPSSIYVLSRTMKARSVGVGQSKWTIHDTARAMSCRSLPFGTSPSAPLFRASTAARCRSPACGSPFQRE